MMFTKGQSVVYVHHEVKPHIQELYPDIRWPILGGIYTVRGYACEGRHPAVLVEEIWNQEVPYLYHDPVIIAEAGFYEGRFEPVEGDHV